MHGLPLKMRFHLEALHQRHPAMAIGSAVGLLAGIIGVGGGFIMVPAMIYLLMPTNVVIGTSLFQISSSPASRQSCTRRPTSRRSAAGHLLMVGSVARAIWRQRRTEAAGRAIRALLAILVLAVAIRLTSTCSFSGAKRCLLADHFSSFRLAMSESVFSFQHSGCMVFLALCPQASSHKKPA